MSESEKTTPIEDRGEVSLPHLRERSEPTAVNGKLPVWLIVAAVLVAAIGFGYLGNHLESFSHNQFLSPNYVAVGAQGDTGLTVEKSVLEQMLDRGEMKFVACASCHQKNGEGGSGIPPLVNSKWVSGPTERLGLIIMHGVAGPIAVNGVTYNSNMAPPEPNMSAKDLAALMTYLRVNFGDESMIDSKYLVVSEEVAANIQAIPQSGQVTAPQLEASHSVYTEGVLLDPTTGEPL